MMNTKKKEKIPSTTSYLTMGFLSTHTNHPTTDDSPPHTNGASFTYIGKETTFITNLFKKTDLKIAWRTTYTIQKY